MHRFSDADKHIRVFSQLNNEKQRTITYEAYLALYLLCAERYGIAQPETDQTPRTIEEILDDGKNEEFLTSDRDPAVFGGITILAALRAQIETEIKQAITRQQNAKTITSELKKLDLQRIKQQQADARERRASKIEERQRKRAYKNLPIR